MVNESKCRIVGMMWGYRGDDVDTVAKCSLGYILWPVLGMVATLAARYGQWTDCE